MPLNFTRCIVITSYLDGLIKDCIQLNSTDYIICADGGYDLAKKESIVPHLIIGDFDSMVAKDIWIEAETGLTEIVKVPSEKDDTDTMLCVKHGLEMGFHQMIILGGIGGRLDHTLANLQALSYFVDTCSSQANLSGKEKSIWLLSNKNKATLIENEEISITQEFPIRNRQSKLSLVSYSEKCIGTTITNVKYPLKEATLTHSVPLGISNEFLGDSPVTIKVLDGKLLILLSID